MKITTLIENTNNIEGLEREHGLSFLIETDGKNILFDTGQSDKFIDNAKKLGVDLNAIDLAILSHGHYDHGGGIKAFLQENTHAPIYLNKYAFEKHFHKNHYVGLKNDILDSDRIIFLDDELELSENMKLKTCNHEKIKYQPNSENFYVEKNGKRFSDDFRHEQYLEIIESNKRILFSGCSHKGILNITNWFKPDVLIGGFHLMDIELDESGKLYLEQIANELNSYNCKFFTCHCTGKKQYAYLKDRMPTNLDYLSTGKKLII